MHATLIEAFDTVLCAACFAMFLVPPGYLAASLTNLNHFRQRSRAEQLLWSIALSLPLTLLLAELLARLLSATTVIAIFAAIALAAAFQLLKTPHTSTTLPVKSNRATTIATAAALLLATYLIVTLVDIQAGHRLFVATTITDWGVRIPLVESAIRSRVPPLNPLSALGPVGPLGHAVPTLRYYYFWYVLCALPSRLLHTPPDAALIASAVWAGFALLATSFLAFKYFVAEHITTTRQRALHLLLPMLVIGLDILPTIGTYLGHASHPWLDIEWWSPDHTPGLLTALVYAPHHIAGLVCCFVAYLILIPDPELPSPDLTKPAAPRHLSAAVIRALLAGACFAACVGTSTFIAFIFVIASLLWTITLLRTSNFAQLTTLAGSGIFAYIFSRPFLHELKSNSSAAHGFATFAWRSSSHMHDEFLRRSILLTHPIAAFIAHQPFILALDFAELGFFAFVAAHQIRTQLIPALRGKLTLTQGQRALWSIFLGATIAWLFLSSAVTSSGNDLGGHAGLIMRFILVLWSPAYLHRLHTHHRANTQHKLIPTLALTCFALGLIGGLADAILHRIYVPLFDAHILKRPIGIFFEPDHLSERFYDIHSVWQQLDRILPADARVQSDPVGPLQMAVTRYSNRQLIASDNGCGTAFGGDLDACIPIRAQLRHLFADDTTASNIDGLDIPASPKTLITTADFTQTCRNLSLSAILVNATDPVWNQPQSWVWTLTPIAAEPTARAYLCPTSNPL